jgi:CheY-like chemotaxis protein
VKEEVFENPNIRILLVDDNRVNQFLGKRLLKNIGIENVDLCSNGIDALSKISELKYDVLLTDIEMPGMNGYELSKAVRAHEHSKELLIIALTGNASDEDKAKATESGIDVFITKPYSPEDLLNVLKTHTTHTHYSTPAPVVEIKETIITHQGIQQIYDIFKNNTDDVRHFLMMLSFQLPELHKEILAGIENQNWELVFQATHKIKSPLKLFGDEELFDMLDHLSNDAKSNHDTDSFKIRMEKISSLLDKNLQLIHEILDGMI